MENLKSIWNKFGDIEPGLEKLIPDEPMQTTLRHLQEKETKRRNLTQWLIPIAGIVFIGFISLLTIGFTQAITLQQMMGMGLVFLGLTWMVYQFISTQISMQPTNYDQPSNLFLKEARMKLIQRRSLTVLGTAIYLAFLVPGLHLILFQYIQGIPGYGGFIGLLYGSMLAIGGYTIAMEKKKFFREYGDVLTRIDQFLQE
ncbi:MAG: hypothetical protein V4714_05360 [Bacteroidota bacterium]